jgi:hypothetical protein
MTAVRSPLDRYPDARQPMILATLDTSNFNFVALGRDQAHAEQIMRRAWNAHRRDYGRDVWTYDEISDSVNFAEISVGTALRDGSPLRLTRRTTTTLPRPRRIATMKEI